MKRSLLGLSMVLAITGCGGGQIGAEAEAPPVEGDERLGVAAQPLVQNLASGYNILGLDGHDGKIVEFDGLYYYYGTRYGKGSSPACDAAAFAWGQNSPWCGFGVWTSPDLANWTFQRLLFDPLGINTGSVTAPGETWQQTCPVYGCFNPRMIQRPSDGKWIFWFNAPGDYSRSNANAYYAMTCAGPAGPCGPEAGGTSRKPNLWTCYGNGDFDVMLIGGTPYIACTMPGQTLNIERLDPTLVTSAGPTGTGITRVGGLTAVESPSVFASGNTLFLTYSKPNCAYCSYDGTGWAKSTTGMLGSWTPSPTLLSNGSCNGQPRSIGLLAGKPYEWIDQWFPSGAVTQTAANVHLEAIVVEKSGRGLKRFANCP